MEEESTNGCSLWHFRMNLDVGTPDQVINWCNQHFKFWVFQSETGNTGYEHYQGEGSLRKKRRKHEALEMFRNCPLNIVPNYFNQIPTNEAKRIKNVSHLMLRYAAKADTRIAGPWNSREEGKEETYIPPQYRGKVFKPWQQTVIDIGKRECAELDERHIHWIYDPVGSHGKSNISSLIELQKIGIDLPSHNDYKQLCEAVCNELMDTNNRNPGIMVMDMPRAMPKHKLHGITTALEQFKKGKVVDMRNHYKKWWFSTPSVWVFSNSEPPMEDLSADRWRIWSFDGPGCEANLVPWVKPRKDQILESESSAQDL